MSATLFGLGYRRQLAEHFFDFEEELDVVEILVEHFFPLTPDRIRELERLREAFELIPHGVSMSLGSSDPRAMPMFDDLKKLLEVIGARYFSEHVAISRAGGFDIWHLSPVWRTEAGLELISGNVEIAQNELGLPIVLETITETVRLTGADYEWGDFLARLVARTDATLLVDVTNVWLNARNQVVGDAKNLFDDIAELPWTQFHVAGYSTGEDGFLIDSHDSPIPDHIFDCYQEALSIQMPEVVILERDAHLDTMSELIGEVGRLRSIAAHVVP